MIDEYFDTLGKKDIVNGLSRLLQGAGDERVRVVVNRPDDPQSVEILFGKISMIIVDRGFVTEFRMILDASHHPRAIAFENLIDVRPVSVKS